MLSSGLQQIARPRMSHPPRRLARREHVQGVIEAMRMSSRTDKPLRRDLYRLAVQSCPEGLVVFDREARIVLANAELERLFGYKPDELIGERVDRLVPGFSDLEQT